MACPYQLLLLVLVLDCSAAALGAQPRDADTVVMVRKDDPGMVAAIDSARRFLPELLALLTSPPRGLTYLAVKTPLTDGTQVEHVWLHRVSLRHGRLVGRIANDLETLRNWQSGDSVSIVPDSLSDWTAIVDGHTLGGFSVHFFRAHMAPAERAQFDKETHNAFVGPTRVH